MYVCLSQGPTAAEADESDAKNVLLSQLSRENDDLKQRLLSTDAQLMDLQEDNLNKLEAAKIMTKQLNARLTEIGVQQENKDGKSEWVVWLSVVYFSYFLTFAYFRTSLSNLISTYNVTTISRTLCPPALSQ